MLAIIGGSGFEKFDEFEILERLEVSTPFGPTSSGLSLAKLNGEKFIFLSRHGRNHEVLPSQIPHKANLYALKKLGAKVIISISAVGSLKEECKPGDLVVPWQYIDRTKKRFSETTYFGDPLLGNLVGHLSMGEPIDKNLLESFLSTLNTQNASGNDDTSKLDFDVHTYKTYICMEGPNFSTRAESLMYQNWGADIIGMTNFPEYSLAKELNMYYLPLCFVTDYDSWRVDEHPVTLEDILTVMRNNNSKALNILKSSIKSKWYIPFFENRNFGLKSGLMSRSETLTPDQTIVYS
jgi:5'-methylthioadenosine phosphorylase